MAKQRSNVPKFGNWDNEDNVPYTVYFDKARKNRGGKLMNPNDPQENPEVFANMDQLAPPPIGRPTNTRPKREEPNGRGSVMPIMQDCRPPTPNEGVPNFPINADRGQRQGRSARPSIGSEHSFDQSPAKVNGRGGGGTPLWEARNNDSGSGTPGRSRLRPTRPDETVEKGAAVPRFGVWNENDPQSDQNFTHIFNKVREERNTAGGPGNATPRQPSSTGPYRPTVYKPKAKGCLFGCW